MIQLARRPDVPTDITDHLNMLIQVHETARITGLAFVALANDAAPITAAALGTRAAEIIVAYELELLMHRLRTQAVAARAEQMMAQQAAAEREESANAGLVGTDGRPLKAN